VFTYEAEHFVEICYSLEAAGGDVECERGYRNRSWADVVLVHDDARAKGLEYRGGAMSRLGSRSFPP